jgi:hypothetical protein
VTMICAVRGSRGEAPGRNPSRIDPPTTQPISAPRAGAAAARHTLSGEAIRMLGTGDFLSRIQMVDVAGQLDPAYIVSQCRTPQTS